MKLSILIPAYNEEKTIIEIIKKVQKTDIGQVEKEIIIIDDGSKDKTIPIVEKIIKKNSNIILYKHKKNKGKGGAIKTGIKNATGDIIIIQDADLEYDPNDYKRLITPIIDKKCKVMYGSRVLDKTNKLYTGLSFYLGGRLVTWLTNILYLSKITDEPTCYKVFDSKLIKSIKIEGNKFDWEPEVTAKILKRGIKISEVPIKYYPRSIEEGKKIRWRDGYDAIYTLLKWRFKKE